MLPTTIFIPGFSYYSLIINFAKILFQPAIIFCKHIYICSVFCFISAYFLSLSLFHIKAGEQLLGHLSISQTWTWIIQKVASCTQIQFMVLIPPLGSYLDFSSTTCFARALIYQRLFENRSAKQTKTLGFLSFFLCKTLSRDRDFFYFWIIRD